MITKKESRRKTIRMRIRKRLSGTAACPRLSVFRSNKQIYAQVIDDLTGRTLASASSREVTGGEKVNKTGQAEQVGKLIAEKAVAAGVSAVKFDRGGYLYHGRIKSLADAARNGGLKF